MTSLSPCKHGKGMCKECINKDTANVTFDIKHEPVNNRGMEVTYTKDSMDKYIEDKFDRFEYAINGFQLYPNESTCNRW